MSRTHRVWRCTREVLDYVRELIEAGEIKAVIDRVYPLEKVSEAHAYVETGRKKKDSVVISIGNVDQAG
ncbi:MAG: zinc-binding dehydrogenase [Woeseiaceae bacterium]